jgi:hypothetical protein
MSALKKVGLLLLVSGIVMLGLEVGEQLSIPGVRSVIGRADAVVGRPATPVSVAGVARRTTRRCAAGVYNC